MTPEEISRVEQRLDALGAQIGGLREDVSELKTLMNTEADRCAYRVDIAKAATLEPRVQDVEKRMHQIDLQIAKTAVIVGLVEGFIILVLQRGFSELLARAIGG